MAKTTPFKYSKNSTFNDYNIVFVTLPPDMFQEALFIIQTEANQLFDEHSNFIIYI